ncbi:MAG: D-glycero-beta-D-manno-heptose-7-phosphate kinase [Crocinitomicaceae bacterium]|nr:D-glycero-beta-D-manno-heptose-7-phosphate kinase [Crocinitomicaceae bacterium]
MNIDKLFQTFKNKKILVVGDVMLDRYMIGNVTRISPEAPVPIIELTQEEDRLGGAANVALNIVALGAQVILGSVIGNDPQGSQIKKLCQTAGIDDKAIYSTSTRKTTVKTRIIGNKQQLLRIDSEVKDYLTSEDEIAFLQQIKSIVASGIDAIIFEDYNKGLLTQKVIDNIIQLSHIFGVITTVDPKKNHFSSYQGVTLFKPNLKELKEGLGLQFQFPEQKSEFEKAIGILHQKIKNTYTFVTLSEYGVAISDHTKVDYYDAHVRTISDVSGAGDTVIAVATLCLVAECTIQEVAQISNLAGGIVCEKSGVVSIHPNELKSEMLKLFNS